MKKKKSFLNKYVWLFGLIISAFAGFGYFFYAFFLDNGVALSVFFSCLFTAAVTVYVMAGQRITRR